MPNKPDKPKGLSGPIKIGPNSVEWQTIHFPMQKSDREQLIAELFIQSFDQYVATQSEPSYAPFTDLHQNPENDIDFAVMTSQGHKLMELAEFAPLQDHGPTFSDAPNSLQSSEKAALAVHLVQAKSEHQGGQNRFLILYATEHGFWLDPFTIERMRRELTTKPPNFDRLYYISIHDLESASVSEIFPGKPHHMFGEASYVELDAIRTYFPHPREFMVDRTFETTGTLLYGGTKCTLRFRITYSTVGITDGVIKNR